MSLLTKIFRSDISRYQKWRKLGVSLASQIVKTLPKELLARAAKDLEMLGSGGVFIFNSEDETSFLMDRAIHDLKKDGRRWIECYIEKEGYNHTQEERRLLDAFRDAYYSVFQAEEAKRFRGVKLADLLSSRTFFLTDVGLGTTLRKDFVVATRVISIEGLHFTSGAACPFSPKYAGEIMEFLPRDRNPEKQSLEDWMRLNNPFFFKKMKQADIPFVLLDPPEVDLAGKPDDVEDAKGDERIERWQYFEELNQAFEDYQDTKGSFCQRNGEKISRNSPCPCGSGKKYKKCCLS